MCSRYYYEEKITKEIEKISICIDEKWKLTEGEIRPSEDALVMLGRNGKVVCRKMHWGFPQHDSKGLLINARCESIEEKKTFKEIVQRRRCVIPASG